MWLFKSSFLFVCNDCVFAIFAYFLCVGRPNKMSLYVLMNTFNKIEIKRAIYWMCEFILRIERVVCIIHDSCSIEGLHDTVCTYARTIFQNLLVSFCTAWYGEKQQKTLELAIYFMEWFEISSEGVRWYSCHSVVIC